MRQRWWRRLTTEQPPGGRCHHRGRPICRGSRLSLPWSAKAVGVQIEGAGVHAHFQSCKWRIAADCCHGGRPETFAKPTDHDHLGGCDDRAHRARNCTFIALCGAFNYIPPLDSANRLGPSLVPTGFNSPAWFQLASSLRGLVSASGLGLGVIPSRPATAVVEALYTILCERVAPADIETLRSARAA